jgi:hypothetical protein
MYIEQIKITHFIGTFNLKLMNSKDFIKQDFAECFNQMRHYDSNIIDSFKFIFTIYVALIGGAISLMDLNLKYDLAFLSKVLIIISIIFCVFVLFYIIELRIYFVRTARYINEIRHFYLTDNNEGFQNLTKFYTNRTKPDYFSLTSSHIVLASIVSLLSSFSIGLLLYVCKGEINLIIILISVLALSFQMLIILIYLKKQ